MQFVKLKKVRSLDSNLSLMLAQRAIQKAFLFSNKIILTSGLRALKISTSEKLDGEIQLA